MPNPTTKTLIASRLRIAREGAGLSQGQVAIMLRLHRPTISEIEAGRRSVSAEELSKFSEIYDVGIEWLSASGEKQSNPNRDRVELAARELSKLKGRDLERLLDLIQAMRRPKQSK